MTDTAPVEKWIPEYRCRWCQREFIQKDISSRRAWVCPTPECEDRQRAWQMLDINNVLFYLPMPAQVELEEAIASQLYGFICAGGPRAYGKSHTIRMINYRYARKIDGFRAYFLRRTFNQLHKNHMSFILFESKRLGFKWANKTVTFPDSLGFIEFSHCDDPTDWKDFIGANADLITFDQLEQFSREQFTEISGAAGRIRQDGWAGLVLAGENPGGPLSAYVDELFISKSIDRVKFPDYRPERYHFLTGDLSDNPYCDPNYVDNLAMMEPTKRDIYRFGTRDKYPGQYFANFAHPKRIQHLDIPADYPRIGGFHWGYFKSGIMLWAVVLHDGRLYIERESVFEETIAANVARQILGESATFLPNSREPGETIGVTVAQTFGNAVADVRDAKVGEDVFETLHRAGFTVIRSEHDPVTGWQRLQHWFATPDGQAPALIIDPSCVTLSKTLPQLIQAPNDIEDVDDGGATSPAKALRYIVMSRPQRTIPEPKPWSRDLTQVDAKTRHDIERLARIEARDRGDDFAKMTEDGWPFSFNRDDVS